MEIARQYLAEPTQPHRPMVPLSVSLPVQEKHRRGNKTPGTHDYLSNSQKGFFENPITDDANIEYVV